MTKEQATREALRMALEALEQSHPEAYRHVITAIKEALQSNEHVEPVAWLIADGEDLWATNEKNMMLDYPKSQVTPLYTTPPQRKPLTDEDVERIIKSNMSLQMNLAGIRADFEAAHGITAAKGEDL